jgi:hypothetical protein
MLQTVIAFFVLLVVIEGVREFEEQISRGRLPLGSIAPVNRTQARAG